jgi:hypothetical protein
MAAMSVPTKARYTLFLDTDIVFLQPFALEDVFAHPFTAKPSDYAPKREWTMEYAIFNMSLEDLKKVGSPQPPFVHATIPLGQEGTMRPYYNAGTVFSYFFSFLL